MKLKILTTLLLLSIPTFNWSMNSLFLKPTPLFPKIRLASPGLTSFDIQYIRATIKESFNEQKRRVATFAFDGPEDLLKRFVNPTLPYNDTDKVGQAIFDGITKIDEYLFQFAKNFDNNIFLSFSTTITSGTSNNIILLPVSEQGRILSQAEINDDLKNYLKQFNKTFLEDGNRIFEDKVIGPSSLTIGYTKNYDCFKHIDFINYSVQAGLWIPSINLLDQDSQAIQPFTPPTNARKNIGIPLRANIEIGVLNWLNIGACGLLLPFFSKDDFVRLNPTATNNTILSNDFVLSKIHHHPHLYFNMYFEAEEFLPKLTFLTGLSYEKQLKTAYEPHDTQRYPIDIVNDHSLHKPWERLTLTFEAELDLAKEEHRVLPRIKFIYAHPFWGRSIYKGSTGSGQFGLEIRTEF